MNDTEYYFDIQFMTTSNIVKKETSSFNTYFDITNDELAVCFPDDNSFIIRIREANAIKSSNWTEAIFYLPFASSSITDENGDSITDEDLNFILY